MNPSLIVCGMISSLAAAGEATVIESAKTAFQYGPFYYAVFLLVTVSATTGAAYRSVSKRAGATPKEIETYRKVFVASYAIGLLLVGVSVTWWIVARPKVYTYTAVIRDLREYETVVADDRYVYSRPELISIIDEDGAQKRAEHLLVVQATPFHAGQQFRLEFAKDRKSRGNYQLEYVDGEEEPAFFWTYNAQTGKNELTRPAPAPVKTGSALDRIVRAAFAAELPAAMLAQAERTRIAPRPEPTALPRRCGSLAELVRPEASVGARIVAAEEVLAATDSVARDCLRQDDFKLVVALRGLSRHSDAELAAKAQKVAQKLDWAGALVEGLRSQKAERRGAAQAAMRRLQLEDLKQVVARGNLSASEIPSSEMPRPHPTGTSYGDRYYVKATWDARSAQVVECLTRLFNSELLQQRTLDEEKKLMRGRSSRVVYSEAPDWAEHISGEIGKCGGKPAYVSY